MGERIRELLSLIVGDILFFILALWLTLSLRYLALPDFELFNQHFWPFLIFSAVWIFVFYIAGLYDKQTVFFKMNLFSRILSAQVVNGIIAFILFFKFPFGINPQTNLVIYIFVSAFLVTFWRLRLYKKVVPALKYKALILADGQEAVDLVNEVNNNNRYSYYFVRFVDKETAEKTEDLEAKLLELIEKENIEIIVANPNEPYLEKVLPKLFDLAFLRFQLTFLDFYRVYEETFDRIPLTSLNYEWFLANVSQAKKPVYNFLKRGFDIVVSLILGVVFVCLLPFIFITMKLEGKGDIFIIQERIGQYNQAVSIIKIRTMTENRGGSATWTTEDKKEGNVVTKVGAILRKLSIDELPQIINVIKGDISLIGPRNDIKGLGERIAKEIPYYEIRNLVKPGITGWAQTHQSYSGNNISPQSLNETKVRLAYDLFYVKNRSLFLDVDIALRTIKTLFSRVITVFKLRR